MKLSFGPSSSLDFGAKYPIYLESWMQDQLHLWLPLPLLLS
jgi:hypothetical protein